LIGIKPFIYVSIVKGQNHSGSVKLDLWFGIFLFAGK